MTETGDHRDSYVDDGSSFLTRQCSSRIPQASTKQGYCGVGVCTCVYMHRCWAFHGDIKGQKPLSFLTKAESDSAALNSVRIRCIFNIKPCKPILTPMK